ncbi:putative reverse transcriptase domain-containing protein [Tanacetum coccineum]
MGSFRSKEDDVSKISTSIFVTNFPDSFSAKDLFHSCKQYGHVVDSFIPTKRTKDGKRLEFVRFINVFNVRIDKESPPAICPCNDYLSARISLLSLMAKSKRCSIFRVNLKKGALYEGYMFKLAIWGELWGGHLNFPKRRRKKELTVEEITMMAQINDHEANTGIDESDVEYDYGPILFDSIVTAEVDGFDNWLIPWNVASCSINPSVNERVLIPLFLSPYRLIRKRYVTQDFKEEDKGSELDCGIDLSPVGDKVMLKVSPWKRVVLFGKRGKLNPRYVGPFKVLEKVREVAYKLKLPKELRRVHNIFHFVEEPVEIMDREVKRLKRSLIPLVKVRWNSKRGPEFTWEREDQFKKKYPHLFTKTTPSSSAAS